LSRIPPSLAELPLRQKTPLLLGLYEFLFRARISKEIQFDRHFLRNHAHGYQLR
jgi:hypothetical protein